MKEISQKVLDRTEELQIEMIDTITELKTKNPFTHCSYDDLVHVFTLMKIAEIQLKIEENERK